MDQPLHWKQVLSVMLTVITSPVIVYSKYMYIKFLIYQGPKGSVGDLGKGLR